MSPRTYLLSTRIIKQQIGIEPHNEVDSQLVLFKTNEL